jgi:signal transduction histidine kinase
MDLLLRTKRPSRWWIAIGVVCVALTAAATVGAFFLQRNSAKPIGEGEVFLRDAAVVQEIMTPEAIDPEAAVRHARNELTVESVSVVGTDGAVIASTSPTYVGAQISNPVLSFGIMSGRFVAVASAIDHEILIDGHREWPAGSILYQVVSPLESGDSLLIHYDVSELLSRRVQPGDIQTETIQLLVLAALFALLAVAVLIGHSRARQRYREVALESELLRIHSGELEETNVAIDVARREAERALALAEEKIRIRAEFVLMINHELRTPLTSVVTGAELLQEDTLSQSDQAEVLRSMVADGERLKKIIDQILAVANIENRGLAYLLRDVPIHEVCSTAVQAHPIALNGYIGHAHEEERLVRTDVRTLALLVASLTDNAMTHGASNVNVGCSLEGSAEPMLEVGDRPADSIFITVADNGPGIDPEFLPRIFEKFEKSSFSSGTGLGLYMARLVVQALDGSLGVSTSPAGSVFTIALPLTTTSDRVGVSL